MKKLLVIAITSAITCAFPLALNAQQTLTFTNPSPAVTVNLLNGSSVNIQTNGNLSAQCQLDANNKCVGMPTGSGGTAPTVSIASSGFSGTPDNENKYAPGTTFNITPTVTNAELCLRNIVGVTPAGTGWTGSQTSPFSATQVTLGAANANYEFSMRCYGTGGAATSAANIILATNAGSGGTEQCAGQSVPPAGFNQYSTATKFPDLKTASQINIGDFPNTGGAMGLLVHGINVYSSIRFTVPVGYDYTGLAKRITWLEAQQGGEASTTRTYITISQCPGDFRVPVSGDAPQGDPTFALGCRNKSATSTRLLMNYATNSGDVPSTTFVCNLKEGNTYYFNMVLRNPYDNTPAAVNVSSPITCANSNATQCGIQLKVE